MVLYSDAYPIVHNDSSEPIELGLLIFYAINTTVPKNVSDTDGKNLGSMITLNEFGRPATQIVCEGDYSVAVYEYIGPEFDINDLTNFKLLRTDDIYDPTVHIVSSIGGETTVNDIEELKMFNNAVSGTMVQVNGYYKGGDCPPRMYLYDENSTAQDDNGGVIKPNGVTGSGRWILVTPDVVDVRYFGVFPSSLYEEQSFYSSRLQSANNYSRKYNRTLYFPLCHGNSQSLYGLDGITIRGTIKLDKNVKFVALGGTTSRIVNDYCEFIADPNSELVKGSGNVIFENVNPYSKWMNHQTDFTKYDKIIYNGSYLYANFTNKRIEFIVDHKEDVSFDGCILEFKNGSHLSNTNVYSFNSMVIRDDWFSGGVMNFDNITIKNSHIDVDNFISTKNYWLSSIENGNDYFDFKGRNITYTESYIAKFDKDIAIANAIMAMGIKNTATTILNNVSGTLYATSEFNKLSMKSCNLHSNAYKMQVWELDASDCLLNINFESPQPEGHIDCTRCNVNNIEGFCINLFNCHIFGEVKSKPHFVNGLYIVDGYFDSNTFMVAGCHSVWYANPTDTGISVCVVWTNNTFLGNKSINVPKITDIWYFANNESDHHYRWKGNTGNCPPEVQYGVYKECGPWTKVLYSMPSKSNPNVQIEMARIYFQRLGGMRWGYQREIIRPSGWTEHMKDEPNTHYMSVHGYYFNTVGTASQEHIIMFNNIAPSTLVDAANEDSYQLCPIWDNYVPCGCVFDVHAKGSMGVNTQDNSKEALTFNMWTEYMLSKKDIYN